MKKIASYFHSLEMSIRHMPMLLKALLAIINLVACVTIAELTENIFLAAAVGFFIPFIIVCHLLVALVLELCSSEFQEESELLFLDLK